SSFHSYNAKFCEPEWFFEDGEQDEVERVKRLKYRGDLCYRQEKYEEALKWYTECIRVVPAANGVVWRDMIEGRARCWAQLGCYEKALKDVASLMHITSALGLSVDIYRQSGNLRAELFDLVQLITLNSTSPWLWVHLTHVYQNLPQESPCRHKQNENLAEGNSTPRVDLHVGLMHDCNERVSADLDHQEPSPHLEGENQKLVKVGNKLSGHPCFKNSSEDSDIWLEHRNDEVGPAEQRRLFAYACVVRVK
uniref:Uncharacterized protein n=1 Tax=Eptatretus burgeri TaxID=7764 RepID=A0A8C4Q9U1_EPTBU